MRTLLFIVLLSVRSAFADESLLTDEERTKRSAVVFTGTVTSTNFVRESASGALYSAQIRIESIEKSHPDLKTNTVIYYEQSYSVHDARGWRLHMRVCPGYPDIVVGQKLKLWCDRQTVEGHTNILFVPTSSWARRQ